MGKVTHLISNFSGGEYTPLMGGHTNTEAYAKGCESVENVRINALANLTKACGTQYCGVMRDEGSESVLIPLVLSPTRAFVIEAGDYYFRFRRNKELIYLADGNPLELQTPYLMHDIIDDNGRCLMRFEAINDTVYITTGKHPVHALKCIKDNDWSILEHVTNSVPYEKMNEDKALVIKAQGNTGHVKLVGVGADKITTDLHIHVNPRNSGTFWYFIVFNIEGIGSFRFDIGGHVEPGLNHLVSLINAHPTMDLFASYYQVSEFYGSRYIMHLEQKAGTSYADKNLTVNFEFDTYSSRKCGSGGSKFSSATKARAFNEDMVGRYIRIHQLKDNTLDWLSGEDVGVGMVRRSDLKYYKAKTGGRCGNSKIVHTEGEKGDGGVIWEYIHSGYGVAKIVKFNDETEVEADVISYMPDDMSSYRWQLGALGKDKFPCAVTVFKERFTLVTETKNGLRLDASNISRYDNFDDNSFGQQLPENAISIMLPSVNQAGFAWIKSAGDVLIVASTLSEFCVREINPNEAFGPKNVQCFPIGNNGSVPLAPIKEIGDAFFLGSNGREVKLLNLGKGAKPQTISDLYEHLLKKSVKAWAFSKFDKTVYIITLDGKVFGILYDEFMQLNSAFRISVNGIADDVCIVPAEDGLSDDVYLTVMHNEHGHEKFHIEVFNQNSGLYLNCAKIISGGQEIYEIVGLEHLEGKTVSILTDGAQQADKIVSGGKIVLDTAAHNVVVGLPFESTVIIPMQGVPCEGGVAQGKKQKISNVIFKLHETGDLWVGPTEDHLQELVFRKTSDEIGGPAPLFSGNYKVVWGGGYEDGAKIVIKSKKPFGFTVLAVIAEIETYD